MTFKKILLLAAELNKSTRLWATLKFLLADNVDTDDNTEAAVITYLVFCSKNKRAKNYFLCLGVFSQSITLTPASVTVNQGTPVTLTCTYIGPDLVSNCAWVRNGTQLAILSSSCVEGGGGVAVDAIIYSYTCPGGNMFTWTINSVTFEERNYIWECRMYYSGRLNVSNTLKINVQGKLNFLLEYKNNTSLNNSF